MNDEIKLMLNIIKDVSEYKQGSRNGLMILSCKDYKTLYNYITNLQTEIDQSQEIMAELTEENEYLKLSNPEMNIEHFRVINENKRKIDNLRKQNKDLQQENETRQQDINNLTYQLAKMKEENERLKQNQVKTLNRIRDFINSSKCEITEGPYSNDKHSQYWSMFKGFAEELQDKIKGIDTKDYVYIPKWREEELLNQEEQLEDYKSRCEKAIEYMKYNATSNYFDKDKNMFRREIDLLNILQNGSENK